jgi:hypothetical protein
VTLAPAADDKDEYATGLSLARGAAELSFVAAVVAGVGWTDVSRSQVEDPGIGAARIRPLNVLERVRAMRTRTAARVSGPKAGALGLW